MHSGRRFIKNDEPQGNQVFCHMSECIPELVEAMRAVDHPSCSPPMSLLMIQIKQFLVASHSNIILTARGRAFGHKDAVEQGATPCRRGEEAVEGRTQRLMRISRVLPGLSRSMLTRFIQDARKEKLGDAGESSEQAASFDRPHSKFTIGIGLGWLGLYFTKIL